MSERPDAPPPGALSNLILSVKGVSALTVSRLISMGLVFSTGSVLGIAMWLTPSPLGHSTHLQLGLGRCTFLALTGYPCPMCGCTTTFTLMAHLRPLAALMNQPFGAMLFVMTVCAFAIALVESIQPRNRWSRLFDAMAPYESALAGLFLLAMGAGWLYKIALMHTQG